MSRRYLLKYLSLAILASSSVACTSFEPEAFVAGELATPPLGCQQLRADTESGDC